MMNYKIYRIRRPWSELAFVYRPESRWDDRDNPNVVGHVIQLSKHSWRWEVSDPYRLRRPSSGRATTKDQAVQRALIAYKGR
jgi:hypothetical protein